MNELKIRQVAYATSKVTTGAELLFISEVSKYIKQFTNGTSVLSLKGVTFDTDVFNSEHFEGFKRLVVDNYIVDVNINPRVLVPNYQINLETITPNVLFTLEEGKDTTPWFSVFSEQYFIWESKSIGENPDGSKNYTNNKTIVCNMQARYNLLSLIAMVYTHKLLKGFPERFIIRMQSQMYTKERIFEFLYTLDSKTSLLSGDWLELQIESKTDDAGEVFRSIFDHASYESWLYDERDKRGNKTYSVQEKKDMLKSKFRVGDLVFLYKRGKTKETTVSLKPVEDCMFGVITGITSKEITVRTTNHNNSKEYYRYYYDNMSEQAQRAYPMVDDFINDVPRDYRLSYYSVGVETAVNQEDEMFIKNLEGLQDHIDMVISVENNVPTVIRMGVREACYWLAKEYDMPFNEEHCKELYFGTSVPAWEQYNVLNVPVEALKLLPQ